MTREKAIEIAKTYNLDPPDWVIEAILDAVAWADWEAAG